VEDEREMIETADGILLRPKSSDKLSFEESFKEMAAFGSEGHELHEFDGTLEDGLQSDDYSR
jgi:hypothetical protein